MLPRLQAELASLRPPEQPMPLWVSANPLLDTWKGAAALAAATGRNSSRSTANGSSNGGSSSSS
jgi:actin-related protein